MSDKYLGVVIDKIPSNDENKSPNAMIKVIAIKDGGSYKKLSYEETKTYCPPTGKVFGPQFFAPYNSDFSSGPFVEFDIKRGQEKETKVLNQTDFIVDYNIRPKAINLPRLLPYNGKIKTIVSHGYLSPTELAATVDVNSVFNGKTSTFFLYDQETKTAIGIFKYSSGNNSIQSNFGKDVQEFKIQSSDIVADADGASYLLFNPRSNTLERGSLIDFMTNQQLEDWFKSKVQSLSQIDREVLSHICEFAEAQSFEDDRDISRLERLKAKNEAIDIGLQTIIDLICNNPKFTSQYSNKIGQIEKEVKENFEKKYIEQAGDVIKKNKEKIDSQKAEIESLKIKLENEKQRVELEVAKEKEKLTKKNEKLTKEIESKEKTLQGLKDNYDSVIATISAAVSLLNSTPKKEKQESDSVEITRVDFPKGETAKTYKEINQITDEKFIKFLQRQVCFENKKFNEYLKQTGNIFSHRACFIPNTAIAFLFAKAFRNTEVLVIHIEHDWLHYSDFCKHGLLDAFNEAAAEPSKNFILLLDGLNITQPECGLRPLLNFINNNAPLLDGFDKPFPRNLTIMATLMPTNGDCPLGLKLDNNYFNDWFVIGNPTEPEDKVMLPDNFYEDEVSENEGFVEPTDLPKESPTERAEGLENYLNY